MQTYGPGAEIKYLQVRAAIWTLKSDIHQDISEVKRNCLFQQKIVTFNCPELSNNEGSVGAKPTKP